MNIPRNKNGSLGCYYDYSTNHKILILGCYGSIYDIEQCTCDNGVFDLEKLRNLHT